MILFFDTETTGFYDHAGKHRVCQLAAILTDDAGAQIEEINHLIKPDGWTIPESATKSHGITTEQCEAEGVPMRDVLEKFSGMKARADTWVAFNLKFDSDFLRRESGIYSVPDVNPGISGYCTMAMAKARMSGKFNLQEAHTRLLGKPFDGAHDALNDVRACIAVFFAIRGGAKPEPIKPVGPGGLAERFAKISAALRQPGGIMAGLQLGKKEGEG